MKVSGAEAMALCQKFPDASTRTLASKLYKENPALFTNYESARTAVRRYRGENGDHNRTSMKHLMVATGKHNRTPPSLYKEVEPLKFTQNGAGCVLSDIHVPYHDVAAVECALDYARTKKHTDFVILNGDICDIHTCSRFEVDPREKDFAGELEAVRQLLDMLTGIFKKVYFKFGNHELRFEHYMWRKAPELIGISDFELPVLLQFADKGIIHIAENKSIHVGGLTIVHGHEFGKGTHNPVNAARGLFMRGKSSSICGHHHATSEHTEQTLRGKVIATWGLGCLCGLQPKYYPMAFTKWNHGFALLDFDGKDEYEVENRRIVKGKVR